MAVKTAAQLKAYFVTGAKPTEGQFADLIDTLFATSGIYIEFLGVTASVQDDRLIDVLWSQLLIIFSGTEGKTGGTVAEADFDNVTGTITLPNLGGTGIVEVIIKPA